MHRVPAASFSDARAQGVHAALRTVETPKTGATTYTPGSLDADLFVFDLSNDKLVGGGHIVVKMDGVGTLDSKSAQNELDDAFGKAVDSAIRTELSISAGS